MPPTPANRELWRRLLAGELTRVFVFGSPGERCNVLATYLPRALSLEPIDVCAYRYSADGTLRPESEQAGLAQQLSAGDRWIAEGLTQAWATPFMACAQAIVFFDLPSSRAQRPSTFTVSDPYGFVGTGSSGGAGGGASLAPFVRLLWYLPAQLNVLPGA
jgi:hypothetical protein